jgi:hypothetical protein
MDKRFKVDFSGKGFPEYRPTCCKFRAPDLERAKEWASKQIVIWGLDPKTVKAKVIEIPEDPKPEETKKDKKKKKSAE